jgi:hypothetical protein
MEQGCSQLCPNKGLQMTTISNDADTSSGCTLQKFGQYSGQKLLQIIWSRAAHFMCFEMWQLLVLSRSFGGKDFSGASGRVLELISIIFVKGCKSFQDPLGQGLPPCITKFIVFLRVSREA